MDDWKLKARTVVKLERKHNVYDACLRSFLKFITIKFL